MKINKWFTFIVIFTLMIWMQSLLSGELSSAESSFVTQIVSNILHIFHISIDLDILHYVIRKIAHFTEYFILGILWLKFVTTQMYVPKIYWILISLVIMLIAAADELIQLFHANRTSSMTDFLIDISGSFSVLLVYMLYKMLYNRNVKKNEEIEG